MRLSGDLRYGLWGGLIAGQVVISATTLTTFYSEAFEALSEKFERNLKRTQIKTMVASVVRLITVQLHTSATRTKFGSNTNTSLQVLSY